MLCFTMILEYDEEPTTQMCVSEPTLPVRKPCVSDQNQCEQHCGPEPDMVVMTMSCASPKPGIQKATCVPVKPADNNIMSETRLLSTYLCVRVGSTWR